MTRPLWMILIGFVLVLVGGIILPLLMVAKIIPVANLYPALAWFLVFFSYGMSVVGLFLGIIGSAMYVRLKNPPKK